MVNKIKSKYLALLCVFMGGALNCAASDDNNQPTDSTPKPSESYKDYLQTLQTDSTPEQSENYTYYFSDCYTHQLEEQIAKEIDKGNDDYVVFILQRLRRALLDTRSETMKLRRLKKAVQNACDNINNPEKYKANFEEISKKLFYGAPLLPQYSEANALNDLRSFKQRIWNQSHFLGNPIIAAYRKSIDFYFDQLSARDFELDLKLNIWQIPEYQAMYLCGLITGHSDYILNTSKFDAQYLRYCQRIYDSIEEFNQTYSEYQLPRLENFKNLGFASEKDQSDGIQKIRDQILLIQDEIWKIEVQLQDKFTNQQDAYSLSQTKK